MASREQRKTSIKRASEIVRRNKLRADASSKVPPVRRENFEQLVSDILFELEPWLSLPDGPTVDDAREAVMRELLAYSRLEQQSTGMRAAEVAKVTWKDYRRA